MSLHQWAARLRMLHRRGDVSADRVGELELLPGWSWEVDQAGSRTLTPRGQAEPRPPPRTTTAGAAAAAASRVGCTYTAAAARQSTGRHLAGWLDTTPVRCHLRVLLTTEQWTGRGDQLITVGGDRRSRGHPVGVVRQMVDGRAALLELTEADVLAVRTVGRSRGRLGIDGRELVDPAPTWAILDRLTAAGWTGRQIGADLGYRRRSSLPFTRTNVTAITERAVTRLWDGLGGDLAPPEAAPTRRVTLARGACTDAEEGLSSWCGRATPSSTPPGPAVSRCHASLS